jgi:DNA-binding MltR family transcriptional regulator
VSKPKKPGRFSREEAYEAFDTISKGSDLAVVLIATSLLDLSLENLLRYKFRKNSSTVDRLLHPNKGILGNIAGRAQLCYCLELISKSDYQDLLTILEIRNLFAHNPRVLDFNDEQVVAQCKRLRAPCEVITPNTEAYDKQPKHSFRINVATLWRRTHFYDY